MSITALAFHIGADEVESEDHMSAIFPKPLSAMTVPEEGNSRRDLLKQRR